MKYVLGLPCFELNNFGGMHGKHFGRGIFGRNWDPKKVDTRLRTKRFFTVTETKFIML